MTQQQLDETARIYREVIFPTFDSVLKFAKDANVVVSSNLTNLLCILMRQRLMEENYKHIPQFAFVHLQPLAPNRIFPCYRTSSKREVVTAILDHFHNDKTAAVPGISISEREKEYFDTYFTIDEAIYERLFQDPSQLPKMCSMADYRTILKGEHPDFAIINAYTNFLVPAINTKLATEGIMDVGPLADNYQPMPLDESTMEAMERIEKFCEGCRDSLKPLCIGFGSMPFRHQQDVFNALKQVGNPPTILVGKALFPDEQQHHDNILHVSSVPYPWLFPKCSVMICHGGMGVLASCLRAGIPAIVCPAMGDQFLTGSLAQGLGLGRQAGVSLNTLTAEQLVDAIQKVQANSGIFDRCKRVVELIRSEKSTGVERLANWIIEQGRKRANPPNT